METELCKCCCGCCCRCNCCCIVVVTPDTCASSSGRTWLGPHLYKTVTVSIGLTTASKYNFSKALLCPCYSGGRYYDHTRNAHIELSSVEVVGPGASGTCQVSTTYYHQVLLTTVCRWRTSPSLGTATPRCGWGRAWWCAGASVGGTFMRGG